MKGVITVLDGCAGKDDRGRRIGRADHQRAAREGCDRRPRCFSKHQRRWRHRTANSESLLGLTRKVDYLAMFRWYILWSRFDIKVCRSKRLIILHKVKSVTSVR